MKPKLSKYPRVKFGNNVLIGKNVKIGKKSIVGSNTIIEHDVIIGSNCIIGSQVMIKNSIIGDQVVIQDGCKIGLKGFGFIPLKGKNFRFPHIGKVILKDNVELGASCTIDRGSVGDTIIGENGIKLSGGEKQRLSIARAFLKNSKIILLDEATSSLDSETEDKIQKALNILTSNKTTLVIAHRLSTILNSDNIYVMDKGCVVDTGTHEKLLKDSEIYKNYYNRQIKNS